MADNTPMGCVSCPRGTLWRDLSRAAAKSAASRMRRLGLLATDADWTARASVCERCPIRVVISKVTYCGKPLLRQIQRDPVVDGCGCPTREKAKDPAEHCPLNRLNQPARRSLTACDCKWCQSV